AGMDIPGAFKPEVATDYARRLGVSHASFLTGYAEDIPLPDSAFDLVIMEDVLEHVRDPEAVIGECLRVLRPGGRCVARFPSIRMIYAHHFDRALSLPGLHYLMPMRKWSAGFNHYLATHPDNVHYVPFAKVVPKKYHKSIGMDLSGLTLASFRSIITESSFDVETLALVGFAPKRMTLPRKAILPAYRALRKLPVLDEVLASTIVFVGRKPDVPDGAVT
ncbi:MAG: class I SAM-dependent methyltransferase, partial [Actinobacteria bacterium]|nr:class I SAM-dependent methyltransferase [Actinomycetota bacterium]